MIERALIDTGPLVALYHPLDPHHERCRTALGSLSPPLFTCLPVLTEAAWLLRKRPDGFRTVLNGFATGLFALLPLTGEDLPAIAALLGRYEECGLQFADAALAHLAGREQIHTVFTTDRRDFSIIGLAGKQPLNLIPEVQ